jgi:hypothetical protein
MCTGTTPSCVVMFGMAVRDSVRKDRYEAKGLDWSSVRAHNGGNKRIISKSVD